MNNSINNKRGGSVDPNRYQVFSGDNRSNKKRNVENTGSREKRSENATRYDSRRQENKRECSTGDKVFKPVVGSVDPNRNQVFSGDNRGNKKRNFENTGNRGKRSENVTKHNSRRNENKRECFKKDKDYKPVVGAVDYKVKPVLDAIIYGKTADCMLNLLNESKKRLWDIFSVVYFLNNLQKGISRHKTDLSTERGKQFWKLLIEVVKNLLQNEEAVFCENMAGFARMVSAISRHNDLIENKELLNLLVGLAKSACERLEKDSLKFACFSDSSTLVDGYLKIQEKIDSDDIVRITMIAVDKSADLFKSYGMDRHAQVVAAANFLTRLVNPTVVNNMNADKRLELMNALVGPLNKAVTDEELRTNFNDNRLNALVNTLTLEDIEKYPEFVQLVVNVVSEVVRRMSYGAAAFPRIGEYDLKQGYHLLLLLPRHPNLLKKKICAAFLESVAKYSLALIGENVGHASTDLALKLMGAFVGVSFMNSDVEKFFNGVIKAYVTHKRLDLKSLHSFCIYDNIVKNYISKDAINYFLSQLGKIKSSDIKDETRKLAVSRYLLSLKGLPLDSLVKEIPLNENTITSLTQHQFSKYLAAFLMKTRPDWEVVEEYAVTLNTHVDIAVIEKTSGRLLHIFEYNGPLHYRLGKLNWNTQFNMYLVEQLSGVKVTSVKYSTWHGFNGEEAKNKYLEEILSNVK